MGTAIVSAGPDATQAATPDAAQAATPDAAQAATTDASERALVTLAREGDGDAFGTLALPYCAGLRAHCYRMLGSVHDAEDALQDTLLHAWRGFPGFEDRSSVRSWLHAIATNAALDIARRRSRGALPVNLGPAGGNGAGPGSPQAGPPGDQPGRVLAAAATPPDERCEQRESVELAFTTALRDLPPLQLAALLLREVAGLPATDIAQQLGTSTASVNSALQRARATARSRMPAPWRLQRVPHAPGDQRMKAIAGQCSDALESGDTGTLVAMLRTEHQVRVRLSRRHRGGDGAGTGRRRGTPGPATDRG